MANKEVLIEVVFEPPYADIRFRVKDYALKVIQGARCSLFESQLPTMPITESYTDANGEAVIRDIPPATYRWKVVFGNLSKEGTVII